MTLPRHNIQFIMQQTLPCVPAPSMSRSQICASTSDVSPVTGVTSQRPMSQPRLIFHSDFAIVSTVLINLRMVTIPPCLWREIISGSTKTTVRCSFRLFTLSKRFEEAEYSPNITFSAWHFQLFFSSNLYFISTFLWITQYLLIYRFIFKSWLG